jgi:hypothetical protein
MATSLFRTIPVVLTLLLGLETSPLHGQWRVGAEVGAARFWGASVDNDDNHTSFRPYRPTTFGLGLERQYGRYAVGLQVHYAEAGLALEGPDVVVAAKGASTVVSISPEFVVRLATLGSDTQLRVHAGPLVELWDLVNRNSRTRLGAQGSVSLDFPLGERFGGVTLVRAAVTPSPYEDGELDLGGSAPTYDLRTLWRRQFAVGLRYRL